MSQVLCPLLSLFLACPQGILCPSFRISKDSLDKVVEEGERECVKGRLRCVLSVPYFNAPSTLSLILVAPNSLSNILLSLSPASPISSSTTCKPTKTTKFYLLSD